MRVVVGPVRVDEVRANADPELTGGPAPITVRRDARPEQAHTPAGVVDCRGGELELSHYRSVEMRFFDDMPVGRTVALNVQDFAEGTGYSEKQVENCKLF
jgi:hypothetical protein